VLLLFNGLEKLSSIEVRPTALLCYHADMCWTLTLTLTYGVDFQSQKKQKHWSSMVSRFMQMSGRLFLEIQN